MQYQGDAGYHRGPIHVGETRITWRSYAWTDEQIKNYLAMKNMEDLELLASIDSSLRSAMEALGTDLMAYLEEAEKGKKPEEEKPEKKPFGLMEPFTALGKGVTEMFGVIMPKMSKGKTAGPDEVPEELARKLCWTHYNIFKKAHGLLAWG
jgi:hypothetical protein